MLSKSTSALVTLGALAAAGVASGDGSGASQVQVEYGFDNNVVACPGDSVTVIWRGEHNIQETVAADCTSEKISTPLHLEGTTDNFKDDGDVVTFSQDELTAQPGQRRYFKCDDHCGPAAARFEVFCPAETSDGSSSSSSSGACQPGLPANDVALEVAHDASLCSSGDDLVRCSTVDSKAYVRVQGGRLVYSEDPTKVWEIKDANDNVRLVKEGDIVKYVDGDGTKHAAVSAHSDVDFVNLATVNDDLGAGVTLGNCNDGFQSARNSWIDNSVCEQIGNKYDGQTVACASGADACADGYEFDDDSESCRAKSLGEDATESQKKTLAKNIRKGNAKTAFGDNAKQMYKAMLKNTRTYLKEQYEIAKDKAENAGKKARAVRKQLRMPLSISDDSEDFKPALRDKLRQRKKLAAGQDVDIGIIMGPENHKDDEACADYNPAADFDDGDNCITYDAETSENKLDVHELGTDDSYNVGGYKIDGVYVPVSKQVLSPDGELFEMSCWNVDAWVAHGSFAAGGEVKCEAKYGNSIPITVPTVVGSSTPLDGECGAGLGCVSADGTNCDSPLQCEQCAMPEANNAVDASPCANQDCAAGRGYDASNFDPSLDPTDTDNSNCQACEAGKFSLGGTGQCQPYSTTCETIGYARDENHVDPTSDRPCVDVQAPTFTSGASATVVEQTGSDQVVYTASATDNSGVSPSFSLKESGDYLKFSIDGATGAVTLTENPDHSGGQEAVHEYSFTVVATDAEGNAAEAPVTLEVLRDLDGDGVAYDDDVCVITGCSAEKLTDAYALLASSSDCSGSLREHAHTDEDGCKTAGCAAHLQDIRDAFEDVRAQCNSG